MNPGKIKSIIKVYLVINSIMFIPFPLEWNIKLFPMAWISIKQLLLQDYPMIIVCIKSSF